MDEFSISIVWGYQVVSIVKYGTRALKEIKRFFTCTVLPNNFIFYVQSEHYNVCFKTNYIVILNDNGFHFGSLVSNACFFSLKWKIKGPGNEAEVFAKILIPLIQSRGLSWHQLEHLSRDRGDWRDFVSGLCSEME